MTHDVRKFKKDAYNCEECVLVPATDIYETENEFVVKADMPGVKKEDVEITLENNQFEINAKVTEDAIPENEMKYREYRLYNYNRAFTAGDSVNRDGIQATLEKGVLTLTLQKSERIKPKRIAVTVEQ